MSEKVFDSRDAWKTGIKVEKAKLPVVSLEALQKWCKEQKRLLAKQKATDAFNEGELTGSIEQLEIMLAWAKKEANK